MPQRTDFLNEMYALVRNISLDFETALIVCIEDTEHTIKLRKSMLEHRVESYFLFKCELTLVVLEQESIYYARKFDRAKRSVSKQKSS